MRRPLVGMLFGVAACLILVPTFAQGKPEWFKPYESRYLTAYERCWEAFKDDCGRNLLDYAWTDNARVPRARVEASTDRIRRWLNPPVVEEPIAIVSPDSVASAPSTSVAPAPASTGGCVGMEAESGSAGYAAYNPSSGAYGCYQVIPSTAAAHGCDLSTPAGQDACAQAICATEGSGAWAASGANPC